jgi:hypothetical protein
MVLWGEKSERTFSRFSGPFVINNINWARASANDYH